MSKAFQAAIDRKARACDQHNKASVTLGKFFVHRYGVHYSDADCDDIVERLDYNGVSVTVAEADEFMEAAGHPPLKAASEAQEKGE